MVDKSEEDVFGCYYISYTSFELRLMLLDRIMGKIWRELNHIADMPDWHLQLDDEYLDLDWTDVF